ncbi:hypothetical protein [Corynebacterium striatum]|uniref:hypothetical protein n=1 Tax=Corynebacterium striatum TaxID=43770 RepID=UPI003B5957FB
MQLEVEALGDEHAIVGFWDVEPGVNLVLFWNGVEDRGCCGERASVSYEDVFGDVVTECPFASDRVHVDSVARPSVLPEHDGVRPLLPVVTELAARWQELDTAQTPARVFEAVAGILPAA